MYAFFQLLFILLGCLQAFAVPNERTYTLQVTQDVTLQGGSKSFNDLQYLIVGSQPLKRSLMKFEEIPGGCSSLLQATLHIYFVSADTTNSQVSPSPRHIVAHTVLTSWSESQATSINLGTQVSQAVSSSATVQPTPGHTWYTIDVTPQAEDWKAGSNYGLLLRATPESIQGGDFRFASNAYGDSTKHAYITLRCSVEEQSG